MDMKTPRPGAFDDLMFHVRCSVKYHAERRRFYENVNNLVLFLALVLNTATIASVLDLFGQKIDGSGMWIGLIPSVVVTVLIGLTLVGRVGTKANDHNDLKRRFIRLQQQMEQHVALVDDEALAAWKAERLDIEMDEPPINRVVHAKCYNEVVKSLTTLSDVEKAYVKLEWKHRLFGWFTRAFDGSLDLEQPKQSTVPA